MGPGRPVRHLLAQRLEHGVAPLAVHAAEGRDLALPVLGGEVLRDDHLVELWRAQHRGLGGQHQLLAYGVRREHPAHPQARREGLGERAQVEHVVAVTSGVGPAGADRRHRGAVEAEQAVRVVLQHHQAGGLADRQDLLAARLGQRDAGRVVEVGHGVEELGCLARGPHAGQRLAQRLGHQPVGVHGDVDDLGLVGREGPERTDVGGGLGDHHVTRVDEDPGHQVQGLLAADRDDDVLGGGVHALERHDLADQLAQLRVALARAVLQGLGAAGGDQLADELADGVQRQRRQVGHAAGQADHLRTGGDREQGPDLRGGHPVRALGVPVGEGVQRHGPRHDVDATAGEPVRRRSSRRWRPPADGALGGRRPRLATYAV